MNRNALVVSIPHAGCEIPQEIRARIPHTDHELRDQSDLYTDQIYTVEDVRTVHTQYSRIIGDPNRAPDEMYTEGDLRTLGVVILQLPSGKEMFVHDPSLKELAQWVHQYHLPYHQELSKALSTAEFLIDGHSMCSIASTRHYGGVTTPRADIVLGNQYFCSCSAETTQFFADFFLKKGYSVAINNPYPGRYIMGTYCSRLQLPGIQIEINRKLYLDETTLAPHNEHIRRLHDEFSELVTQFCDWFSGPQNTEEKDPVDLSHHE